MLNPNFLCLPQRNMTQPSGEGPFARRSSRYLAGSPARTQADRTMESRGALHSTVPGEFRWGTLLSAEADLTRFADSAVARQPK